MVENQEKGSVIRSVSVNVLLNRVAQKYKISPSIAFKNGLVLLLRRCEGFPEDAFEEYLNDEAPILDDYVINKIESIRRAYKSTEVSDDKI